MDKIHSHADRIHWVICIIQVLPNKNSDNSHKN
jgi:hypothetical protein